MKKATAFAPGHISGFFQPITDSKDFNKIGSRGAGVSIVHGAKASVEIIKNKTSHIDIRVNEKKGHYYVIKEAVKKILEDTNFDVTVDISLDLPLSHGFGMSAACALSASLAIAELLEKGRNEAIQAAHYAEIMHHTGLGDVCSSAIGGFEIREKPGIFPYAKIHKISEERPILLVIFPDVMSTETILTDANHIDHISEIGKQCTDQVLKCPTVDSIMKYSYYFTVKSNLAPKNIIRLLDHINAHHQASMCMLGHSLFIIGKLDDLSKEKLSTCSFVETLVDIKGARIIDCNK